MVKYLIFFSILAKFRTKKFFPEMNFGYFKGPLSTLERIFLILVPGESRFRTVILLPIPYKGSENRLSKIPEASDLRKCSRSAMYNNLLPRIHDSNFRSILLDYLVRCLNISYPRPSLVSNPDSSPRSDLRSRLGFSLKMSLELTKHRVRGLCLLPSHHKMYHRRQNQIDLLLQTFIFDN